MNAKELIRKTRDGEELSAAEIDYLVRGAASEDLPAYQLTAWMMAVYLKGLTRRETVDLTRSMILSGETLAFPDLGYALADKHSTGGVGDKISFLAAPLAAAAGVPVPMISGRSLGHTGGTLDKLESIPGFRTRLEPAELIRQVESIGLCIAGQSERLAPADRILYALRDASSIVESIPLITASILCKKAAAGVRALVLDVKCGDGAFMRDPAKAHTLARSLVETAALLGMKARAHLTSMERVLGFTAGNSLEIAESVRFLRGEQVAPDLEELTLALACSMCELSGRTATGAEARRLLQELWKSGAGYEKFRLMVQTQGGETACLDHPERLPRSRTILEVPASGAGRFLGVRARAAGAWLTEAGGGRLRAADPVDPRVGLEILLTPGAPLSPGQPVMRLHLGDTLPDPELADRAARWIQLEGEDEAHLPLLGEVIEAGC